MNTPLGTIGDTIDYISLNNLAGRNPDGVHPLDEYVADASNWLGWNEWRGSRNDCTRPHILAFIEYCPKQGRWLFGEGSDVLERDSDGYVLAPMAEWEEPDFVGTGVSVDANIISAIGR